MAKTQNQNTDVVREAEEIAEKTYRQSERLTKKADKIQKITTAKKTLNEARLLRRQQKQEDKLAAQQLKSAYRQAHSKAWFSFFTKWFFVGLLLICGSVILSSCIAPLIVSMPFLHAVCTVTAGISSAVGIALVVGAVFDFSKNSEAFVQFVSNILSDIVVSKTFLTTLSQKDKEKALSLILKPSDSQIEQYSNINDFFSKRINELMTMFDTNFKTDVILNIDVYKEPGDETVYCKTVLTQTVYKIQDSFKPVGVHFEKPNSVSKDVYALPPSGESIQLEAKEGTITSGGIVFTTYSYEIPKECEKYDHLTIKRTMIEPGFKHWANYYWQSLTPYEGLVCTIKCEGDLSIKDHMIFDNKAYYHVVLSEDKKRIEITSSQWLDTDTGFAVTISDRADDAPAAPTQAPGQDSAAPQQA